MRKTKINIQFDSDIINEEALSFMGEYNYLNAVEDFVKKVFGDNFDLNGEGTELKVKVEIAEEGENET